MGAATRTLLACGLVAGPLFLLLVIAEALTRPGFDPGRHPISLLSLGDLGWIQVANFIGSGLLILAFAVGLRRALNGRPGGTWGPLLLGAYGTGLIVAGICVPDPAWSFPPGGPQGISSQISWHAAMHGVGFMLAFGAISLACLVFACRWMALGEQALGTYTITSALVAFALSLWPGFDGAAVRYFVAAVVGGVEPQAVALLTDRLGMIPMSAAAPDALIDSDRPKLEAVTHAHFPDPLCAPPLMADALASMRKQVHAENEDPRQGPWLAISRTTREAVGSVGLSESASDEGTLLVGYSIYPEFEGCGYATEATKALIAWALSLPGTRAIQATIPRGTHRH